MFKKPTDLDEMTRTNQYVGHSCFTVLWSQQATHGLLPKFSGCVGIKCKNRTPFAGVWNFTRHRCVVLRVRSNLVSLSPLCVCMCLCQGVCVFVCVCVRVCGVSNETFGLVNPRWQPSTKWGPKSSPQGYATPQGCATPHDAPPPPPSAWRWAAKYHGLWSQISSALFQGKILQKTYPIV